MEKWLLFIIRQAGIMLLLAVVASCTQHANYEKTADGVIIRFRHIKDLHLLRLRVLADKIIQVTAAPADSFSVRKSLMTVPDAAKPSAWTLKEEGDHLIITTAALRAKVSLINGQLIFSDTTGKVILQEQEGGGKSFQAVQFDGEKTYQLRQVFDSPADEAFYGLGQHQQDFMNYKGHDVDLTQSNSVAVVPFLVSSRNYGILWDNYSITRFGDPRQYESLATLKTYSKDGASGGLTAIYEQRPTDQNLQITPASYSGSSAADREIIRKETSIDYEYLPLLKNIPEGFNMINGKVTWEGFIESSSTGDHKFINTYAGYVKTWIDNNLVVDAWRQCWNPTTANFTFAMEAGKRYPLKVEWIPDGGESYVGLQWLSPQPAKEQNKLSLSSEAGDEIDYYFIAGQNADEIIKGYRQVTGKAPVMPKWAMGLWQSRERYRTQDELLSVLKEFRTRKIPLDNIVLDWFYWKKDQWGSHEFDPERFPDPDQMISDIHNKYNAHFMISVWPKFYEGTGNYRYFDEHGWLYKRNIRNRQKDWVGFVSTFYDAFNPQARDAFWDLMQNKLYNKGVDAWWLDATEPDILSNSTIEERKQLMNPTYLGSSSRYFNAFSIVNASAIYEGQRKAAPDQRVFILTRSAYAGLQRYSAATWSGDIGATWHDLKRQIPAGVNFCLSGIPYWTMDIGGFSVQKRFEDAHGEDLEEWREQMTRWFQFGSFCPLFRVHGQYPYREIFNIAPESHPAYQSMLYYDNLRYQLMPYLYSLAGKTWLNDYTLMRGLIMDFAADNRVYDITDQYMFGPSLLVNPVYRFKARSREVYLPANTGWYDLYTGMYFDGGQKITAQAPLERMPVFAKEGAILPVGPQIQYTTEKPADPITLYVFTGRDGYFEIYEDEGVNYNYEKGNYTIIPCSYHEQTATLTIGERKGFFPSMKQQRTFQIVWVTKENPVGVSASNKPARVITYTGERVDISK